VFLLYWIYTTYVFVQSATMGGMVAGAVAASHCVGVLLRWRWVFWSGAAIAAVSLGWALSVNHETMAGFFSVALGSLFLGAHLLRSTWEWFGVIRTSRHHVVFWSVNGSLLAMGFLMGLAAR
jgi:hypothetical protein